MSATIWQYWFPIAMGVAAAAAWLGRPRAYLVGALGAGYWCVLALDGISLGGGGTLAALAGMALGLGGIVVVAVAMTGARNAGKTPRGSGREQHAQAVEHEGDGLAASEIAVRFEDWLVTHRNHPDPWPDFGEFVREVLHATVGGRHVRAYRVLSTDDGQLYPLRLPTSLDKDFPSARTGIVGHVVTSGKSYYDRDCAHGDLVDALALAAQSEVSGCAWCFAIKCDRRPIGVVRVGDLDEIWAADFERLKQIEAVLGLCWLALSEATGSRRAGETDPVSDVLTQQAFVTAAERALEEAYERAEPVAIVNVSVEGLRRFADHGQWDIANQLLFEVSALLKERLRDDDRIGVFDGSRFLLLLRRVDSGLAMLIVRQLLDKVAAACGDDERWSEGVRVRCGVAGSGVSQPDLRTLIARATQKCQQARKEGADLAADLPHPEEAGAV